ncbi:MAG TPA: SAM-dependent methyltransferase, partial [Clostridiales bacterium]|nr:SAM-dependent methyltransferase [Clostridiales bacterium]
MNAFSIDPDEQIDDLFLKNYKIIQKQGCFRYGTDAVVLSDFAEKYIKKGSRLLDVGT